MTEAEALQKAREIVELDYGMDVFALLGGDKKRRAEGLARDIAQALLVAYEQGVKDAQLSECDGRFDE